MQLNLTRPSSTRLAATAAVASFAIIASGCGGKSNPTPSTNAQSGGGSASVTTSHETCPLTGLAPTAGQNAKRAPLAVKIDNIAPALPQAGVNNADVVVEELVEGGLTRLMAIFQCSKADNVGPIRSARISDADILALLHGSVLGYSGANPKDMPPIRANSNAVLISQDSDSQYFHRDYSRPAPHNVFSSTSALLGAGMKERPSLKAPKPLFSYGPIDPGARNAHKVSMSWSYGTSAAWTWQGNHYLRTQDGSADRLSSGQQISAANIVVMNVDIASTGLRDVLGSPSPQDVTVGSNKVWVLRDGKLVRGRWNRPTIAAGLTLTDAQGKTIDLSPGRTWIELLPTGRKPSVG